MFFEIIFHSGQPDIVPHIFLRLDMYKMHTETERGKKTHKGIYRQQILLVEIGEKGYAFYVFKSHERHIFGNCQNRYACRFKNFGRNAPYQIALFTTFPPSTHNDKQWTIDLGIPVNFVFGNTVFPYRLYLHIGQTPQLHFFIKGFEQFLHILLGLTTYLLIHFHIVVIDSFDGKYTRRREHTHEIGYQISMQQNNFRFKRTSHRKRRAAGLYRIIGEIDRNQYLILSILRCLVLQQIFKNRAVFKYFKGKRQIVFPNTNPYPR